MVLVVELVQYSHVLAVAHQPIDGGKVLPLRQLLVQSPEHLNKERKDRTIEQNIHTV